MVFHTTPYRLAVLIGLIVLSWLLVSTGVLPADVAISVNFIVVLCALAPVSEWLGKSRRWHD